MFYVNEHFPPVFLCVGEVDLLHSQSIEFAKELSNYNVPYKLLSLSKEEYPEATHSFLNFYKRKCSKVAMEEGLNFLENYSKEK